MVECLQVKEILNNVVADNLSGIPKGNVHS